MKKKFLLFLLFLMTACCSCKDTQKNVFEQTVEVQLAALRSANDQENWKIPEETFAHLVQTAPAWPEGRLTFRSFRIRFGAGDEGVAQTFEAHVSRIRALFGDRFWRPGYIKSSNDRLRLLAGNSSHRPIVEWILIDLGANRERVSIADIRRFNSLADELLVFIWLFPSYIPQIDYNDNPGLFAGGYQVDSSDEFKKGSWPYALSIDSNYWNDDKLELDVERLNNHFSGYSVPVFYKL